MASFSEVVSNLRAAFKTGKTHSLEWRLKQLYAMRELLLNEGEALCDALKKDLNKPLAEAVHTEVLFVKNSCTQTINDLPTWIKREKAKGTMLTMTDTAFIQREPLGVTLIIGAWNYPVQLVFSPLIGAIAGGNCSILKPSELSPHTSKLLTELVPKYFDDDCIKVVQGGASETTELLKEKFDLIFYTGSSNVGKIIAAAAAKHLTPCVLELGGKSPCYVDEDADLGLAARRIMWGKVVNCGQTCIAPDYILCTKKTQDALVKNFKSTLEEFFPKGPQADSYGRIVNKRHFQRIASLLKDQTPAIGGELDENDLYISPTVITNVARDAKIMQEEIFGPVLPIITIENADEAIEHINSGEKPLAMYVFSSHKKTLNRFIDGVSCGGICTNDCLMQNVLDSLPFGGVGNSGYGKYHGRHSFDVFTNAKSVLMKYAGMETMNQIRYPPYTSKKSDWLEYLARVSPKGALSWFGFGGK